MTSRCTLKHLLSSTWSMRLATLTECLDRSYVVWMNWYLAQVDDLDWTLNALFDLLVLLHNRISGWLWEVWADYSEVKLRFFTGSSKTPFTPRECSISWCVLSPSVCVNHPLLNMYLEQMIFCSTPTTLEVHKSQWRDERENHWEQHKISGDNIGS